MTDVASMRYRRAFRLPGDSFETSTRSGVGA